MDSNSKTVWNILLTHGFDLDTVNSEAFGDALPDAADRGDAEMLSFLLEAGADPNKAWGIPNEESGLATYAFMEDNPDRATEILLLLLKHGWDAMGTCAHIAAAELGDLEALKLLVEHGADI